MARATLARQHLHAVPGGKPATGALPTSDAELIDAVRRGDSRVASELYDRLIHVVDRTLYRILGRRTPDRRDLIQATFEQIVHTLSTGRFAGACSLETWASVLAAHVGMNALRSSRREAQVIERPVDPYHPAVVARTDVERELDARSQLARVRRHLAEMTPTQATTLFLHDGLGHNLSEIALITGVSISAAQSRLVRGRRELNRRMQIDTEHEQERVR
jgi:RNA polymerase sigma-70 factor, ECF subfamily